MTTPRNTPSPWEKRSLHTLEEEVRQAEVALTEEACLREEIERTAGDKAPYYLQLVENKVLTSYQVHWLLCLEADIKRLHLETEIHPCPELRALTQVVHDNLENFLTRITREDTAH